MGFLLMHALTCVSLRGSVCVYVCDHNTVAVYPGPSSKQLVPICFFFCSCGLRLMEWGALACGVWVWTNSGEVCTAAVCVCVWMWFMATKCSCVYMWFCTRLVYLCVWAEVICVNSACLCAPARCDRVCALVYFVVSDNHILFPL